MKNELYSTWVKKLSIEDLPNHVLKAWREGWKHWSLVDTEQHNRLYDGYMKTLRLEKELSKIKGRINRKLTWKERFKGVISE